MTTAVNDRRVNTLRGEVNPRVQIAGNGPPVVYLHGAMGLVWQRPVLRPRVEGVNDTGVIRR